MITIDSIMVANFMQYGSATFDLSNGFWAITGKNRSGKSSIVEAVLWCLYGQTARGSDMTIMKRGAEYVGVTVYGHKDGEPFVVVRTRDKSVRLVVSVDKNEVDKGTVPLTQAWLEKYLGADFRTFSGAVLFGHNSFRFTRAKDSERKNLFESVLPLERFEDARKTASEKCGEMRTEKANLKAVMESVEADIERLTAKLEETTQKATVGLSEKIDGLEKQYKKVVAEIEKLPTGMASCVSYESARERMVNELKVVNMDLEMVDHMRHCPKCGQMLNSTARKYMTRDLDKSVETMKNKLEEIAKVLPLARKHDKLWDEQESLGEAINALKDELKAAESGKSAAQQAYKKELAEKRRSLTAIRSKYVLVSARCDVFEFWVRGFSKSGVVSLLIDSAVEQLNEYCLETSQELTDGLILVQFDTVTQKKTGGVQDKIALNVMIDGEVSPYENLSNSEQQRADLIVMLAWQKLMVANAGGVNVVFFDEVMEGLDEESVRSVISYIARTRRGAPTYLISHLQDQTFQTDGVIRVYRDVNGSHISLPSSRG